MMEGSGSAPGSGTSNKWIGIQEAQEITDPEHFIVTYTGNLYIFVFNSLIIISRNGKTKVSDNFTIFDTDFRVNTFSCIVQKTCMFYDCVV
jgi:hypothetical protein